MQKQTFRFWWSVPHHMPWSTLITVATSTHLSKSVSTDLRIQMGCKIGICNKTSTPKNTFIMTPSLEGWPTKAKEELSHYEIILALQGTNAVCQVFQYQMSKVKWQCQFQCQVFQVSGVLTIPTYLLCGPFLWRVSTASRLQSHYQETVYFSPLSLQ